MFKEMYIYKLNLSQPNY